MKRLGVTDKPFLRANVWLALATAIGAAAPGRRSAVAQVGLAGVGLAAAAAGRAALNRAEAADRDFELPVASGSIRSSTGPRTGPAPSPSSPIRRRFYRTDINLRPPAIDLATWALSVETPAGVEHLDFDRLTGLGLRERDAVLACVHNRPGWDRLGQQRWTGVPLEEVLEVAGGVPGDRSGHSLVSEAADGYTQVMPLEVALELDAWVVVGMAGEPLLRAHGFPARLMTPGIVGQYNGVKWMTRLAVVPAGIGGELVGSRRSDLRGARLAGRAGLHQADGADRSSREHGHAAATAIPAGHRRRGRGRARRDRVGSAPRRGRCGGPGRRGRVAGVRARRRDQPLSWRRWRARLDLGPGIHEVAGPLSFASGRRSGG